MRHWTYLILPLACLCAAAPLEAVFHLRVLRRPRVLITVTLCCWARLNAPRAS